jgi:hypothetical protein
MPLTMKDITDECARLNRFQFEAGPYGVTTGKRWHDHQYRLEPMSGIGGPGRWRIKRLPDGRQMSGTIETKRQLRKAMREWLAEVEYGPRPPEREGFIIYAHDNGVRTNIGMCNAIVWSYRRVVRRAA